MPPKTCCNGKAAAAHPQDHSLATSRSPPAGPFALSTIPLAFALPRSAHCCRSGHRPLRFLCLSLAISPLVPMPRLQVRPGPQDMILLIAPFPTREYLPRSTGYNYCFLPVMCQDSYGYRQLHGIIDMTRARVTSPMPRATCQCCRQSQSVCACVDVRKL